MLILLFSVVMLPAAFLAWLFVCTICLRSRAGAFNPESWLLPNAVSVARNRPGFSWHQFLARLEVLLLLSHCMPGWGLAQNLDLRQAPEANAIVAGGHAFCSACLHPPGCWLTGGRSALLAWLHRPPPGAAPPAFSLCRCRPRHRCTPPAPLLAATAAPGGSASTVIHHSSEEFVVSTL